MRLVPLLILLLSSVPMTAQLAMTRELPLSTPAYPGPPQARFHPALASDGSGFLAVWEDQRTADSSSENSDVFATRVSGDGQILDPDGIVLAPTNGNDTAPDVVWNGSSYVAVFSSPSAALGITAVEVRPDGTTGSARSLVRPSRTQNAKLAWNGSVYLLAWLEWSENTGNQLHVRSFDRALAAAGETTIVANAAEAISVASNGSGFLVAFHDIARDRVRAALLSSAGTLQGSVIDLAEAKAISTSATWDGIHYAVAWSGIGLAQLTPSGEIVRRSSLVRPGQTVSLAWNGTRYEIVWSEASISGEGPRVVTASLDSSLFLLDEQRADVKEHSFAGGLDIASSGSRTLVALTEFGFPRRNPNIFGRFTDRPAEPFLLSAGLAQQVPLAAAATPDDLFGVVWLENEHTLRFGRVTPAGKLLDGSGIELSPPAFAGDFSVTDAKLAATREQFVAVYQRSGEVFLRRISSDGLLLDRQPLLVARHAERPAVVTDGRDFVVAWSEYETLSSLVATRTVLYAATLTSDGILGPKQRISPDAGESSYEAAGIVRSGDGYIMAILRRDPTSCSRPGRCSFDYSIELQRLSAAAEPSGQPVRAIGVGFLSSVTMAASSAEVLVAWAQPGFSAAPPTVAFQRFSHALAPIGGSGIVPGAGTEVSATADERRFLLVSPVAFPVRENSNDRHATVTAIEEGRVTGQAAFVYAHRMGREVIAASRRGHVMVGYSQVVPRTPSAHLQGVSRAFVRFLTVQRRRAATR